jgi:hypothetical protein
MNGARGLDGIRAALERHPPAGWPAQTVNGPVLSLLQLQPCEAATVPLLHEFAATHPGVRIIVPHYRDEPWRADITAGAIPGEDARTSCAVGADWPSGLLAKLRDLFPDPG